MTIGIPDGQLTWRDGEIEVFAQRLARLAAPLSKKDKEPFRLFLAKINKIGTDSSDAQLITKYGLPCLTYLTKKHLIHKTTLSLPAQAVQ